MIYDMIYLLTAIGFPPGGSSTVHIYTKTPCIRKSIFWSLCKVPLLVLSDFNETWILSTDFQKKYSNIKFYENPSPVSPVFPYSQRAGLANRQSLEVAIRNFGNTLKDLFHSKGSLRSSWKFGENNVHSPFLKVVESACNKTFILY